MSFEILVKHFSGGLGNLAWIDDSLKLYYKWNDTLPVYVTNINKQQKKREEIKAFDYFLSEMIDNGIPWKKPLYLLWTLRVRYLLGFWGFLEMNTRLAKKTIHNSLKGPYRKIFPGRIVKKSCLKQMEQLLEYSLTQ